MRTLYFCPVVSSSSSIFFFPRLISAVADWLSTIFAHTVCGLSANLRCKSETCCMGLAANTVHKKSSKIAIWAPSHNLSGYIFATKAHIDSRKKFVKQQYLLSMSSQYGELRSTNSWDRFVSLGHPCKFQRVSRLGSLTARHSSIGRQPNFPALNRGRHLYSAGRLSRWALAHILVLVFFLACSQPSQIGCLPHLHAWCVLSANLECRSEMCCTRLAASAGPKKSPKIAIWAPLHNFVGLYLRN